ncbi:helix-turn-helix transcriptional regulator [Winogradskyella undariae]|uniref:winged helix-turn-helix transcriptional regulator n=1 Tax=Winogradskyella TaxID=286104 RepID=UPI00156A9494|nr:MULTISPECIES: helix-turn-helix domain-containing protein [Winogradskyella]NRR91794.1 helix-turn-helix transcriptional regulator [Winogradskyella undariae]QNK78953.1 helix-turn-helix transcriptional regulator [Winogradskyella sp. PAMC22761]QXP78002.1 helix-turn-helix transcriptional regulator [Winogradskyella sp. HaHa_3_26]
MNKKKNETDIYTPTECKKFILPVRDVIDIVGGKWRLPIIIALSFKIHRFKELERQIEGITPRMLSKELKELETNGLVNRKVFDTIPASIEYSLTDYGKSLDKVIETMREWGLSHRNKIINE